MIDFHPPQPYISKHTKSTQSAKHIVNIPCHIKMKDYHLELIEEALADFSLSHPDHADLQ